MLVVFVGEGVELRRGFGVVRQQVEEVELRKREHRAKGEALRREGAHRHGGRGVFSLQHANLAKVRAVPESLGDLAFLALAPLLNEYIEARRLEKTQTPETPPKPCGRSRLRL